MTSYLIFMFVATVLASAVGLILGRASKRGDRVRPEMKMRYKGGDLEPCRVCGEPVTPAYADDFGPVHIRCREDIGI
jgi:hypothetical protein